MRTPAPFRSLAGHIGGRFGTRGPRVDDEGLDRSSGAWAASLPPECPSCRHTTSNELSRSIGVCPSCRYHWRIPARVRLAGLLDAETFVEDDADLIGDDPLEFACPVPYRDLHTAARQRTGLAESVVTGHGEISEQRVGVAVFDFGFMGGTMGVAAGEKLVRLLERCTRGRRPVVIVTASGGVRLQEGTPALFQMAAVAAAMQRHHAAGLLSITVLADPSTGGVLVAPGTLGDIVLAEPGAHIAFAGARVSGSTHPPATEWLREHGMIDAVVDRAALRETVGGLLDLLTRKTQPLPRRLRPVITVPEQLAPGSGRKEIELARRADRPTALQYISRLTDEFIELHGDRLHGDDEAIAGGIGSLHGQTVLFIAEERSRPESDSDRRGKPGPDGFRKVLRLASLAATFGLPIITLIDTPGAQADEDAEGRGLAFSLGRCLRTFSALPVPVVAAIIGEGTSGAAIALAPSDRLLMQEHATFESISPEGAAAILGHDRDDAPRIAEHMRLTARDALALGVVDEIVPEPGTGAHADPDAAAALLGEALVAALAESQRWLPPLLIEKRYGRLRSIGAAHLRHAGRETQSEPALRRGRARTGNIQSAGEAGHA